MKPTLTSTSNIQQRYKEGDTQQILEEELNRIKKVASLGSDLKVKWLPNPSLNKQGEVKGDTIIIYEEDRSRALVTLKHEIIHHHINKEVIEPLVKHINLQKSLIEDLIYKRVEELADKISKLL